MADTTTLHPPEKLDLRSHDIAEDKRQALLRLFPEIRTEEPVREMQKSAF